jgi:hypothetical protein
MVWINVYIRKLFKFEKSLDLKNVQSEIRSDFEIVSIKICSDIKNVYIKKLYFEIVHI